MQQQDVRASLPPAPQIDALSRQAEPISAQADWRTELRRTVLSRVFPRLSDAGRNEAEVARFCDLALAADGPGLLARAEALRAGGVPVDELIEGVMASAAQRLGDLWLADRLSFLDVTAAIGHVQGLLRALGPALEPRVPVKPRRILLAPAPGEQHVFGLAIVAAFFRRAGWDVTFETRIAFGDLLALVRTEPFAAIGLSAAGDRFASALPGQIDAIRGASLDPDVVMLAGGPAFAIDPELRWSVGADLAARDAAEAVRGAGALSAQRIAARARS